MTARLALVELRQPTSVIGTGTVHCVRPGFFYGLAGMIAEHVSSELGEKITVIATGGPAWKNCSCIALNSRDQREPHTPRSRIHFAPESDDAIVFEIPDRRRVDQHGVRNIERVGLTAGGGVMPFGS